MLLKSTIEPISTSGDEIKKENTTPSGSPALTNPIKSGIEEHEQNGVIVPKSADIIRAVMPLYLPITCLLLSGGK